MTFELIKLEPLLSNAIVLNLAYLALPKFAYIDELRTMVAERLGRLDPNVVQGVRDTLWFRQAKALTEVRTIERVDAPQQPRWLVLPGIWGALYNVFFYWRLGRIVAVLATGFSLLLLIVAIGDENGALDWGKAGFPQQTPQRDFWLSLLALVWPIIVVSAGTYVTYRAIAFINYQARGLKSAAVEQDNQVIDEFDTWWKSLKKG